MFWLILLFAGILAKFSLASNNQNFTVQQSSFSSSSSSLCNKCNCEKIDEESNQYKVDCRNLRLDHFPSVSDFPKNVKHLDLTHNKIVEITNIDDFKQLEWLSIAENDLKKLSPSVFSHLKKLKTLDLSYNPIGSFHEKQFSGLEELQTLQFTYCRIERFPDDLFEDLKELTHLDISHNPLRYFNTRTFTPLNHLLRLSMSNNEIFDLSSDTFASMPHLYYLDLSGNYFEKVPTGALRVLRNLKELDLSNNPIRDLNKDSFYHVSSLRSLKLNRLDNLFQVSENAFSTLYYLEDLSLENNAILSYIHPAAFYGIFNRSRIAIKNVSFKRNHLASLADSTLPFCNLTSLDLRENPWTCDCHLSWISYCHNRGHFKPNVECATPKEMRGHFIDTLHPSLLICKEKFLQITQIPTANIYIFYMTFFMMCCVFCVAIFLYRFRYANPSKDNHNSIYYLKAQTEGN